MYIYNYTSKFTKGVSKEKRRDKTSKCLLLKSMKAHELKIINKKINFDMMVTLKL